MSNTSEIDFWSQVNVTDNPDECWEWIGEGHLKGGYGKAYSQLSSYTTTASKVAWELTNGPVPKGLCVCHSCDNPPCCNPNHLWLGTSKENIQDSMKKGRVNNEEHRAISSRVHSNPSEEIRRLKSERMLGNTNALGHRQSEAARKKKSDAGKLRKHTEEEKRKISVANKGKRRTAESRARMSLAQTGRHQTEATKEKLRRISKENWTGKLTSLGRHPTEETRRKMSFSARLYLVRTKGMRFPKVPPAVRRPVVAEDDE